MQGEARSLPKHNVAFNLYTETESGRRTSVVLAADLTTCPRVRGRLDIVEFISENPLASGLIRIGEVAIAREK
jgi:hypothetical protein